MPDIAIEILASARNLLASPERWTQGAAARNSAGKHVAPSDPDATCFCAAGAIYRAAYDHNGITAVPRIENVHHLLARYIAPDGYDSIYSVAGDWNDTPGRTHSEILAVFDAAIADSADPANGNAYPDNALATNPPEFYQ